MVTGSVRVHDCVCVKRWCVCKCVRVYVRARVHVRARVRSCVGAWVRGCARLSGLAVGYQMRLIEDHAQPPHLCVRECV